MRALLLFVAVALCGCGAVAPYATLPAGTLPGQPTGTRVAICYDGLASKADEVRAEAQKECPAGTAPQRVDTDWYLQYCPVLLPARATFVCVPAR